MTKTEMIEAIRKAAIAANKSILDLKFGCKIKQENGCEWMIVGEVYPQKNSKRTYAMVSLITGAFLTDNIREKEEIIGRDIGLADVLNLSMHLIDQKYHPHDPENRNQKYLEESLMILSKWDLTKPFHLQSEETIRFIFNLIQQ